MPSSTATPTHQGAASSLPTATPTAAASSNTKALRLWQIATFPLDLWWFVAGLITLAMFLYIGATLLCMVRRHRALKARRTSDQSKRGEAIYPGREGLSSWRRVPSAFVSGWRIALYRWTIPISVDRNKRTNLAELLFTLAYMAAIISLSFIQSPDSNPAQDFANRIGHLVVSQTPLVVGLAGKNNVISFLTGIGPEKLNILHRAAGRTLLVLLWCHFFGRYSLGLTGANSIYNPNIIWGVVALTAFTLTTLISIRPIRNRFYEPFLISHIALIVIFLVAVTNHMPVAAYWIWPSLALMATDRFVRMVRITVLNRLWLSFVPKRGNTSVTALVEPLSEDTLRLTLPRHMCWRPGQHVYLVMPGVSVFPFEAHPFTIASTPHALDEGGNASAGMKELLFIVRARDGFTKRLMKHARESTAASITAFVDGPYGCPPSLLQYTTVVLIAGGSGVSYTLSQLLDLVYHARKSDSAVRRISFVWIIRRAAHLQWITSQLISILTHLPSSLELSIVVHITHSTTAASFPAFDTVDEKHARSPDSSSTEKHADVVQENEKALMKFEQVTLRDGRPDVRALLKAEVDGSTGPVSVDVCGPASLSRAVRSALAMSDIAGPMGVLRGKAPVELHVETFGW